LCGITELHSDLPLAIRQTVCLSEKQEQKLSKKLELGSRDWVADKRRFILAWGLPASVIIATAAMQLTPILTGGIWALTLSWMGFACLKNARQCGRMHCFFSGPYFLISGAAALAIGLQWIQIITFNALGIFLLVGTPVVCLLPEFAWGTYKQK